MTGLVFAKLSRLKKRAQTLMFISLRDGQLYLRSSVSYPDVLLFSL